MDTAIWIDENAPQFYHLSDSIWDEAELKFSEYNSSARLKKALLHNEFIVEKDGIADMTTAFVASYGSGKPIIGILAEFDALDGLSQEANVTYKKQQAGQTTGHGCGHHALGTGAVLAAIALKEQMKSGMLKGTIRLYGCPGEEGGSGKAFMARDGAFDDLDCAITWHPGSLVGVMNVSTLANIQAYFQFEGVSAHAAASPHLGRSALDSVELMNVGANYLREHILPQARLHYAVTNSGGKSPNVVQAQAEVLYLIRAPKISQVMEIYQRVCDIARGAALMCGTTCKVEVDKACSDILVNETLSKTMASQMQKLGKIYFTKEETEYAAQFYETLSTEQKNDKKDMEVLSKNLTAKEKKAVLESYDQKLFSTPIPFSHLDACLPGSSDVGDVSWITPTVQCVVTCYAKCTPGHSWQMVAQGKSDIVHKGLTYAAKVMAATAEELLRNPSVLKKAKQEWALQLVDGTYTSPIPKEVNAYKPHRG